MIKVNLRYLMAHHKIDSITELMAISGLSRNALNKLLKEEDVQSVKLETLIKLCDALNCKLAELITYTPDDLDNDDYIRRQY